MQIPRDKIRTLLIYVTLILLITKFMLIPAYQDLNKKKENWQKLVKNYETLLVLEKEELKTKGAKEEFESMPYFLESSPLVYSILLGIIKSLAQRQELQLLHYEIIETKREGRVEEVPLLVKITGKPVQIYKLLKDLSRHPKIIYVRSLEIVETEQGYEAILNIVAFRLASGEVKTDTNSTKRDERKNL